MIASVVVTVFVYNTELRHVMRPVARTSRGRKTASAPSIAVDLRTGSRDKSTNAKKKTFLPVAELSDSASIGRSRSKAKRTPQLVRNTGRTWNNNRSKDSMHILIWTDTFLRSTQHCKYPVPLCRHNIHETRSKASSHAVVQTPPSALDKISSRGACPISVEYQTLRNLVQLDNHVLGER